MFRKLLTLVTALTVGASTALAAAPASAVDYLGCSPEGRGTVEQPFWICSATDFQQITDYDDHAWALTHDIDMAGVTLDPVIFRGQLNGNGYAFKNLTIDADARINVGLFAQIVNGAFVHDLEIKDFTITGDSGGYVGLLAGNISGRVEHVKVGGSINLTNGSIIGGLAGQVTGGFLVKNVLVNTSIASATPGFIGGVFGAAANVNDTDTPVAGLGQMQNIIFNGHIAALTEAGSVVGNMNLDAIPEAPLCVGTSSVFSIEGSMESQSGTGCTHQITLGEAQEATRATPGFGSFGSDVWLFGDMFTLPILRNFPQAPGRPGVPVIMSGNGGFIVTFGGGFDGGSYITSYSIEIRRAGEAWYPAQYEPVAQFSGFVPMPEDNNKYQVRVRTTNNFGNSEWVEARELAQSYPGEENISASAPQLVVPPVQDFNFNFTRSLSLQDGTTLVPWVSTSPDGNMRGIGISRLDDQGRTVDQQPVQLVEAPRTLTFGSYGRSLVQATDGDIVLVWIESNPTFGDNQRTSKLYSSRSADGYHWSEPVQLGETLTYFNAAPQCSWEEFCGYSTVEVQADGSNGVEALATYPVPTAVDAPSDQPGAFRLVGFSNVNTSSWSQTNIIASAVNIEGISLIGLKTGFLATWSDTTIRSAVLTKPATGRFSAPKAIGATGEYPFGYLVQRNSTTISEVWIEGVDGNTIRMRDYNLKTKRWSSSALTVATFEGEMFDFTPYSGLNGNVGIAFAYSSGGISTLKYVNVVNGKSVTSSQTLITGSMMLENIDIVQSPTDSAVVSYTVFTEQSGRSYISAMFEKVFESPKLMSTILSSTIGTQLLLTPRGKLMQIAYTGEYGPTGVGIEATAIHLPNSPMLVRPLSLSGVARVGKTLTASTPLWTAYTRITSVKYSWYRCTEEPVSLFSQAGNCTVIPKATKNKYKLTKADKGKYVTFKSTAVAVTGTSRSIATPVPRVG